MFRGVGIGSGVVAPAVVGLVNGSGEQSTFGEVLDVGVDGIGADVEQQESCHSLVWGVMSVQL